ncbi:MAG: DUF2520 domain-containing protein [Acidobacteriota bacterium]
MITSWIVLGLGRCGLQLARSMRAAGVPIAGLVGRSRSSRLRAGRALPGVVVASRVGRFLEPAGLVLAVPDAVITEVAASLTEALPAAVEVVLHTSGLATAAALTPLARPGRRLGSLHPLVPFPTAAGPRVDLAGVTAAVEGDPRAVAAAVVLAHRLGMRPRRLSSGQKARYHAAAAVAASLTHALLVAARAELVQAGFSPAAARRALAPLVSAATGAALTARGWERLTGPLVRGDAATIRAHLATLDRQLGRVYRAVSALALAGLASDGSISPATARRAAEALTDRCFRVSVRTMAPRGGR